MQSCHALVFLDDFRMFHLCENKCIKCIMSGPGHVAPPLTSHHHPTSMENDWMTHPSSAQLSPSLGPGQEAISNALPADSTGIPLEENVNSRISDNYHSDHLKLFTSIGQSESSSNNTGSFFQASQSAASYGPCTSVRIFHALYNLQSNKVCYRLGLPLNLSLPPPEKDRPSSSIDLLTPSSMKLNKKMQSSSRKIVFLLLS